MNLSINKFIALKFLSITFLLLFICTIADAIAVDDECKASKGYEFICGPQNAEDLVLVPGSSWIIASGMAPGSAIFLIDSKTKSWKDLYPADTPMARQEMDRYGACPGSPDPNNFITHGLHLRAGENGHSTLYAVAHGGREAIEVFDVDANGAKPELIWIGCVMLPEGMVANSVASFSDGSLIATVPLYPDKTISDAFAGELTGAAYEWSPGDSSFERIEGTELPYGNGIEVSADDSEIYIVSSGLATVVAYSHSNPARQLRTTIPLAFIPDNLHWTDDGNLITAGMVRDYPECDSLQKPGEFDLEAFASCPRPFIAKAIDPQTMEGIDLAQGPAIQHFSNATMALQVGNDIWVGTFSGDRIAYRPVESTD